MSHFARVVNGKVDRVIVAEPEFFDTYVDDSPGQWIQTSYNTIGNKHTRGGTPLRGNFAGIGYHYDPVADVFYAPQPYASWVLSPLTFLWEAPTPMPEDGKRYVWDEPTVAWKEIEVPA
jgi:hypothetical protein